MAKKQQHGNREVKKPKKEKKPDAIVVPFVAGRGNSGTAGGAKKR
jgi:hypothetical protein